MNACIEDVFLRGLFAWRRNPVLGVPFILRESINVFVVACFLLFVFFLANPFSNVSDENPLAFLHSINWFMLLLDLVLFLFVVVFLGIASSFFTAGSIGMCEKALKSGETSLGDLFFYGRRNFMKVFIAEALINLFALLCVVFLFFVESFLGGDYIRLFMVFAGIFFEPIPYAIVIGNTGALEGIRRGFGVSWSNKVEAALTYVFTTCFSSLVSLVALMVSVALFSLVLIAVPVKSYTLEGLIAAVSGSIPLIVAGLFFVVIVFAFAMCFVTLPVTAITWTGFYMRYGKR